MSLQKEVDVLVIGAGPSGTIAASIIHKAGLSVQIVEKTRFPRFVIGESLLPRCMEALEEAGLLDAIKAKGFQRKTGAKFVYGDEICDLSFEQQHTPGWSWTWQVPRAEFDMALADECEAKGIPVHYETEVTAVTIHDDGSSTATVRTKESIEETIKARFIVDGSGYGRVLPTLFGLNKPSAQYTRKTMFCHLKDPNREIAQDPNRIHIVVHNATTWIWIIPFSSGATSVGYVGSPEFFKGLQGSEEDKFRHLLKQNAQLTPRFDDAEMLWEPRALQSWSASSEQFYGKGYVLTGNVTEFLDPVFSSGVTLASVSAQTAANLVIRQLRGEVVNWEKEYTQHMMTGVNVFRTFVNRWYDSTLHKIFFAEDRNPKVMNQICSVLAGYVWDKTNPFVKNSDRTVTALAHFLGRAAGSGARMQES